MPIYEYQCSSCSTLFEELVSSVYKNQPLGADFYND